MYKITSSFAHQKKEKHFRSMNEWMSEWRMVCRRNERKKPHDVVKLFLHHTEYKLSRLTIIIIHQNVLLKMLYVLNYFARKSIAVIYKIRFGYYTHKVYVCVYVYVSEWCSVLRQTLLIIIMCCHFTNHKSNNLAIGLHIIVWLRQSLSMEFLQRTQWMLNSLQ